MEHIKFDFALLLVGLTAFTGAVYGIDRLLFAKKRAARGPNVSEPTLVEYCRSFFPVILFVLLIRSFLAEPFRIPSGSMMPTLLIGDYILVNKFAYGIRLPVLNTTLIETGKPRRGDVAVFKYPGKGPNDPKKGEDYIKRVIGLPGDVIEFHDNIISVNGVPVEQQSAGLWAHDRERPDQKGWYLRRELLPGREHDILQNTAPTYAPWIQNRWEVPPGKYFVMGDNRDNSEDSRFWGMVPEANLVGRAFFIWMNWDTEYGDFTFSRVGTVIRGGQ
jgi:signal peptidase I